MADSALTIEYVPIRTEEDRRIFRPVLMMFIEIVMEMHGYSKGEINDWMGDFSVDFARSDDPDLGDLAGLGFLQAPGGAG